MEDQVVVLRMDNGLGLGQRDKVWGGLNGNLCATAPAAGADAKLLQIGLVSFLSSNEVCIISDVGYYVVESRKPQPYKKEHPAKDGQCHHCKEEGHWKRNCPVYLAELMKKKKKTEGQNVASTSSSIYTIELFAFPKNSWVYDTGCGTHICNTKHGLRGAKKLKHGSLYLYVGNGVRAEVEAIGSFDLVLPNGLIIVLNNCHYALSITRGVVSVFRLVDKGFT
ncbi:retrotransposon protein, putative, ty1-copia subclass [Tanacetum coccineum]